MASKWQEFYDLGYEYKDIRRIRYNLRKVSESDDYKYRNAKSDIYSKFIREEDELTKYILNRQTETGETPQEIIKDYDTTTQSFVNEYGFSPEEMQQFDMYAADINYLYGREVVSKDDFVNFEGDLDHDYIISLVSLASRYKNNRPARMQEYLDCLEYYLQTGVQTVPAGAPVNIDLDEI